MSNLLPSEQQLPDHARRPRYLKRSFGPVVLLVLLGVAVYFGRGYFPALLPPSASATTEEVIRLRQENHELKEKLAKMHLAMQSLRDRAARAEMLAELRKDE